MFAPPPGFNHHQTMLTNGLLNRGAGEAAAAGNDPTAAAAPPHHNGPVSPSRDMSPEMRKARVQNSMRILKDEPVPEGYLRFRFNEDCHYTHCGYREHQTHFHCMRQDCGYSFCDKTRFVQHTARHERYVYRYPTPSVRRYTDGSRKQTRLFFYFTCFFIFTDSTH